MSAASIVQDFDDLLVLDLSQATNRSEAGGKAASLARAMAAGHRVPAGVVVTAAARDGARAAIVARLAAELGRLGGGPFAVRSSAIAEDGDTRSFAGQLETVLSVPADEVAAALSRCWASAEALRALRYAGAQVGPMAVLVQRMVSASTSGVAFSADPHSGERGVTVIEAVRGLGDRLVSGASDAEAWRVSAGKPERLRALDEPVLSDGQAARVAELAREMETLFGAPQDVEWAFEGESLYLLQSRPITALPAAPIPIAIEVPEGGWDRDDHHGVLSPLGWAWFQPYPVAMAEAMRDSGAPIERMECTRIGGHLYLRMVMGGGDSPRLPPRWVLWLASRLVPSLRRADRRARALIDGETFMEPLDRWEAGGREELRRELRSLFVEQPEALTDEELLDRIDRALAHSARGLQTHAWLGGALFALGKLVMFVEDELGWSSSAALELVAGNSTATTALHGQLEEMVRGHLAEVEPLAAPPRTWAALMSCCPELGRALAAWLEDNRLRMLHYEPGHPMLGERPDYVMSILEGVIAAVRSDEAPAATSGRAGALLAEAEQKLAPERRAELERLVALARRGYASRDDNGVDTVSRPAGLLRYFVLELGRRLAPRIAMPEHAVYLYPEEHGPALRGELADLGARIARRRGEESWALLNRGPRRHGPPAGPMPPADVFPDGMARMMRILGWMERAEKTPEPSEGDVLPGVGVGTRAVNGRARVVFRVEQMAELRHGEILVCRITSPEWAVGLGRVTAIVTNEGGALSHPAIIARELGVPAVVGAADATARIRTGDRLRVDPVAATVTLLR